MNHNFLFGGYLAYFVALTFSSVSLGEVNYVEEDDGLTIVRMIVTPAAEPVPALKHRLITREIDLREGNAAPYYYRALLETQKAMDSLRREYGDTYDTWYWTDPYTPSSTLPLDDLRKADRESLQGFIEEQIREATNMRHCDWGLSIEDFRGKDTLAFALPEFQLSRELCRMLAVRARIQIAENNYSAAVETIQINYRLARDVARAPLIVCGLIGIAEAGTATSSVSELIASPGSPNLYWALAELPQPLVDLRPAARFEIDFGPRIFPFIHHAETTDHSPQEWNRLFTQSLKDLQTIGDGNIPAQNELSAGVAATAIALVGYPHAKARLIADGFDPKRVEAMSVGQVMAIYTDRNYQLFSNDFEKLWYVPFWEMRARYEAVERKLERATLFENGKDREVLPIVSQLLPAMHWARAAQVRLERDIAALRVIEALRMYAASHAGGLPKSLDEITEVPIPLNPATGKPFVYRLEERTAILELPKSDGIPGIQRRYEIEIAAD